MIYTALRSSIQFLWDMLDDDIRCFIEIAAGVFEDIDTKLTFVMSQIDPNKAVPSPGTLENFERWYKCSPNTSDTLQTRRDRVISALRATGELNEAYFRRIAISLGYIIGTSGTKYLSFIEGGFQPFRAGISKAGDPVYSQSAGTSMYTVIVSGTNVSTDTRLQYLFRKQILAGIELIFSDV